MGGDAGFVAAALVATSLFHGVGHVEGYTQEEVARAGFDLNCGLGFEGLSCGQVVTCEQHQYCHGHGICMRGGSCICDPGWRGPSCDEAFCPSNCTGHGSCQSDGSGCVCDSGFGGTICDKVACFGGGNCTGHGACLEGGICECDQGYLGAGCSEVDVVLKCSNHGTVDANGDCVCSLWYTGPDCSLVLCMNNCSEHGVCDMQSGKCACDPGWAAADCSKSLCPNNCTGHGTCFRGECSCQDGFSGADCSTFPCRNDCTGHGACLNGTCLCDLLYQGDDCSFELPPAPGCPGNCTGRGSCANNTCLCDVGWDGPDCASAVNCPGNCTGRGTCVNSTCLCDMGFSGADCGEVGCLNNCTLNGLCTANGTCACNAGRYGADCSLSELRCGEGARANCSGHGSCVDAGSGQWWSGVEGQPDYWLSDGPSRHLARRDTGACLVDWYGLPGELLSETVWREAGGVRSVRSGGVPDHLVVTEEGVPICETPWAVSLPLAPARAPGGATPLPVGEPIGFALNGVPLWGAELSDGTNAVEGEEGAGGRVPCYGHASSTGMWHYHHPLLGCNAAANEETLLGYALDGFPIFGPLAGGKAQADAALDACNGRALPDGSYRYHVRTLAQVDEGAAPRGGGGAGTLWNYILGCFVGTPAASLGMHPVMAPLPSHPAGFAGQPRAVLTGSGELRTATVAEQLGLVGREGVCACDPGWVGADCAAPGCISNCSGHGACARRSANESVCQCDPTWLGDDCSQRFNGSCGVGCSGHGSCLWPHQDNATCLCDAQWGGGDCSQSLAGVCAGNCSGRGSCFNGTCACDWGYAGEDCSEASAERLNLNATLCWQWVGGRITNNSCSGRGACVNGSCACDPGWHGHNCSAEVEPQRRMLVDCPSNCSFHGACSFALDEASGTYNGTCACDVGWAGPDCSLDWSGSVCASNCSEHGTCMNGTCVCDSGWTGDECRVTWASLFVACPLNCSGHGACNNGSCACDFGWLGENCSLPLPCPGDCSGRGACILGNCSCDPGFAGADCSHADICPGYLPLLGANCSGHGVCVDGNCSCDVGWGGMDCSEAGCPGSCSGHGVCSNGTCACLTGFIGADCGQGPYEGECPGACTGHGACSLVGRVDLPIFVADIKGDGLLSGTIGCVCDDGWDGPDCSLRSCPNDCSGNGACAQNGTCFCYNNWGGPECSDAWCPGDCGGRGTCVGGVGCICDVGFEGLDCTQSACANNCSMNGVCVGSPGMEIKQNLGELGNDYVINTTYARCDCFFGWGGEDCSEVACPLNCSFPQGNCFNGTCICDKANGYFGQNCSERFGAVSLRTDGQALTPPYGIFTGGSQITVKGTGFVNSETMRCKFGEQTSVASVVIPTPPELPYATCRTPGVGTPRIVTFQFSLDNLFYTEIDARILFEYHGSGVLESVKWPTAPSQGGTEIVFTGINFQFASAVQCKFGSFLVGGSYNVFFVQNPQTGAQSKQGELRCISPPLFALALPASASASVVLQVSMDAGNGWMQFEKDPNFRYYGTTHLSPSFGPQQDQVTQVRVHGFNLFQGLQMPDVFPGFSYQYACRFDLPWEAAPVTVLSPISTWNVRTAPYDGAFFSCTVPPGQVTGARYTGPVDVTVSLNPCLTTPGGDGSCTGSLPFTSDPITFFYATPAITNLSVTLGPVRGGTVVTVSGTYFELRDTSVLPAGYQHLPILCKWGTVVTSGAYKADTHQVMCTSPACATPACLGVTLDGCPNCFAPVRIEVALNGQDYTGSQLSFSYYKDPLVARIFPTLGPTSGGTSITVFASGFGDPCFGCATPAQCSACLDLVRCRFLAFERVIDTPARCLRLADGSCDRSQLVCATPVGGPLRGNIVSLEPFNVAVSVAVNGQQFFPVKITGQPYNVNDPGCLGGITINCAFLFQYYEQPVIANIYPSVVAGDGHGRITVTGSNFLNVNNLKCRFGARLGSNACQSGATGNLLPCMPFGCCVGQSEKSAIYVSSSMIICPTLDLRGAADEEPVTAVSVGVSLNGEGGPNDFVFKLDANSLVDTQAVQVYWATSITPSLGVNDGGTRITVTGINFGALGPNGDTAMRCKFGDLVIVPNPTIVPDPVNYAGGKIECTSPGFPLDIEQGLTRQLVTFGVCLVGGDCVYVGPMGQGDNSGATQPSIHHYTANLNYLFYQAPRLSALLPALGPLVGGAHITVAGTGFFATKVLTCRFDIGHFSVTSTLLSSTSVVCTAPPMSTGTYQMDVTLNGQDYSAGCGADGLCDYLVYSEPSVLSVQPAAGVNTGGTRVQITVDNPIGQHQNLRCRFFAVSNNTARHLEQQALTLEVEATLRNSIVSCITPPSISAAGAPILTTPTAEAPLAGLTVVKIAWNGQQYAADSGEAQRFAFHNEVKISALAPFGGYTTGGNSVDVIGANFVDTPFLVLRFGDTQYLCAQNAPLNECPSETNYINGAITFVSNNVLRFSAPPSAIATRKSLISSNNYQEYSSTNAFYDYYSTTSSCPPFGQPCRGKGTCQEIPNGGGLACVCNIGYSGPDCSIGPHVLWLEPSVGLAAGGYVVKVHTINVAFDPQHTYRVRVGGTSFLVATLVATNVLSFAVPQFGQTGYIGAAVNGVAVEVSVNNRDYTANNVLLRLLEAPTITSVVPNAGNYRGGVRITVNGANFIDTAALRVRIGSTLLANETFYVSSDRIVALSPACGDPAGPQCKNFTTPETLAISLNGGVSFTTTSTTFRFVPDPILQLVTPNTGSMLGGTPVQVTAFVVGGNSLACKFGNAQVSGTYNAAQKTLQCLAPPSVKNETVPVTIALDGQIFSPPANCTLEPLRCFAFKASPVVSRIVPTLGPIQGGTRVTILGSNFYAYTQGQAQCSFGGRSSPMTFVNRTTYTCVAPPYSSGVGDVSFTIYPNGVDSQGQGLVYAYYVHPTLISTSGDTLLPIGSPISGGTTVSIFGSNFRASGDGIFVRFQNDGATLSALSARATFVSSDQIRVVTPPFPAPADLVRVSVSLNGGQDFSGQAADVFQYYAQPEFNNIIPHLGPRLGETPIILNGTGFRDLRRVARCRFGDVTSLALYDDTLVPAVFRCISPPSPIATWVNVEIALDGQVYTSVKTVKFQYYGEYDVTSLTPAGGPSAGQTVVTLRGVGFFMSGTYLTCFIGDGFRECSVDTAYPCYKRVQATYVSPTQVTCVTPSMPQGGTVDLRYPVRMGINGQFSQSCPNTQTALACPLKAAMAFTYYTDVFVTAILPNSGQVQGSTRVTVTGRNFRQDLERRTRCMFTLCTEGDVWMSGANFGSFRNGRTTCTGGTVTSVATAVTSATTVVCVTPLAASADSHFALVDVSLNDGATRQRNYGPLCPDGCPVMYFFYSLPLIGTLTPNLGPERGGTYVTVAGVGYIGQQNTQMRCKFGSVESTQVTTGVVNPVVFLTQTSIRCVAPPQPASNARIQVSLNGLDTDYTPAELGAIYVYHTNPVLTGIPRPSAGPARGGTMITISGTGFRPGQLRCKFWTSPSETNLNLVTTAEYVSATEAKCPTPAVPASQLVSISLSLNAQDYSPSYLAKLFFFFPNPTVTSVYPRGGPAESGGSVLVTGTGFLNTSTVRCRVGQVDSAAVLLNGTMLRCPAPQVQRKDYSAEVLRLGVLGVEVLPANWVPRPVQAYPVEVSFDGQTYSSSGVQYTYYPSPQVDVLTPSAGRKDDATIVVMLNGANFRNDFATPLCRFGWGAPIVVGAFLSSKTMYCRPPIQAMGQNVLVEVALNGQDFEVHKSQTYSFYGVAPIAQAAHLSETFCEIEIPFDVGTDRGGKSGQFPCEQLLQFKDSQALFSLSASSVTAATAAHGAAGVFQVMFGEGQYCSWTTNSTLELSLGHGGAFAVGQTLSLQDNTIMRGKELTLFAHGNVTISSPRPPPVPAVKLAYPSTLGSCDRLTVSATASSGSACRPLYYTWSVDLQTSVVTDDNLTPTQKFNILTALNLRLSAYSGTAYDPFGVTCRHDGCLACLQRDAAGNCTLRSTTSYAECRCDQLDIAFDTLPMGRYALFVVVTNWLGVSSAPAVVTVEKILQPLPAARIIFFTQNAGLVREVYVNRSLSFESEIANSPCAPAGQLLEVRWAINRTSDSVAVPGLAGVVVNQNALALPQFLLKNGVTYVVSLTVNVRGSTLLTTTDRLLVRGIVSPPVAIIAGGDRQQGRSVQLVLDGSGSFHPDFPPSSQASAGLAYLWTCVAVLPSGGTAACTSVSGTLFGRGTSSMLTVPGGSMRSNADVSRYEYVLNVSSASGGVVKYSAAKVKVTVTEGTSPRVTIVEADPPVYVPNLKATFESAVTGAGPSATYTWTTADGDVDVSLIQNTFTPNTGPTLVIKPNILSAAHAYTLRLTVRDAGKEAWDQVGFVVKSPPKGGTLGVSPMSGIALETEFAFEAHNWEDPEGLPIKYQIEYLRPGYSTVYILSPFSQNSKSAMQLPNTIGTSTAWNLQLRLRNVFGAEYVHKNCNQGSTGVCRVSLAKSVAYPNRTAIADDQTDAVTDIMALMAAGKYAEVHLYITSVLTTLNSLSYNSSATTGGRRLLATVSEAQLAVTSYRCDIIAPLLQMSLPINLVADPQALTLAQSGSAALSVLMAVPLETNDNCTKVVNAMTAILVAYLRRDPASVPDATALKSLSDTDSLLLEALKLHYTDGRQTRELVQTRVGEVLARQQLITSMLSYGAAVAESAKQLESTLLASDTQRLAAPITPARRSSAADEADEAGWDDDGGSSHFGQAVPSTADSDLWASRTLLEEGGEGGGGRALLAMGAGTTLLPAVSVSKSSTSIVMVPSTVPVAIPRLPCKTSASGSPVCYQYSVSAAVTLFKSLFNPYFFLPDASSVVSSVVRLQLRPFGLDEDVPLAGISSPVVYELQLSRIPNPTEDDLGRRRVAACVRHDGSEWTRSGCMLTERTTDVTGTSVRVKCACNASGIAAVMDLQGGCDGLPLSPLVYDGCRVCGGDNSTCRGCDGVVASGKKLDGCLVCGGDNSSCAGCDGVPNSGRALDWCGVCGGDNSTCTGCDGQTVHAAVTARTGLVPKEYDTCQSPAHPLGVCGGCDASCKGCDGVVNSGKDWDKCGRCGPYTSPTEGQYSTSSKDNCSAGLTQCPPGQAPDACAQCLPLPVDPAVANQACMGCDGVPRLFGRKVPDNCGLCGGNSCSCKDCLGIPGGSAKFDRCGVCNGFNLCLDCKGVPYGPNTYDICGVCGGLGDPAQCTGCDGNVYPRPTVPPYLDAEYQCCPAARIGCNGLCNATVGCDGNCSKAPKRVDKCGVCGGAGLPNTGTCDCAGTPRGTASLGCDMQCRSPPLAIDTCGVCGGTDEAETGHCDCAGVPYGPSLRDTAQVCCTVGDMGCDSRCFSGKTFDVCGECGGDGGTCLETRPIGSRATRGSAPPAWWRLHLLLALSVLLCAAVDDWLRGAARGGL